MLAIFVCKTLGLPFLMYILCLISNGQLNLSVLLTLLAAFRLDPVGTFKKSAHAASIDLEVLLSPVMDEEFTIEIKQFKNLVKVRNF